MRNSHHSIGPARRSIWTVPAMGAALLAGSAIPAAASMTDLSALSGATRVTDDELSDMHGKFVTPQSVSYFGITMLSSWQDASGVTTLANLVFSVEFLPGDNGNPVPQLMIAWTREGDPAMDVTDTHEGYVPYIPAQNVLGVGALETFAGAAQANVIAGADNRALNGMQVMIVPSSAVPALAQGGMTSATGPVDLVFADGDELHFQLADNQVGILMTGNGGNDSASQLAGGDIGQLLQQSILNSDNNAIENRASVIFGVDALQNVQIVRAQEALSAMKGHGF